MNFELFIARKVFFEGKKEKGISHRIVSIAVGSISLGLAVMIVSVAILIGFKNQIREKVIGFGSHIQVVNYDSNNTFETKPIKIDTSLIDAIRNTPGVVHVETFATKPGVIKTDTEIHAIVMKGVDANFDWSFFRKSLKEGRLPATDSAQRTNDVIISRKIATLLKLKINDPLYCNFYNEEATEPRMRNFNISGIYESSVEEFDKLFIIGDVRQIQKINDWKANEVSGYEVNISDFDKLDEMSFVLSDLMLNRASEKSMLKVTNIKRKYSQIFDWLNFLDVNVWVILCLMIIVSGINMISGVLILILERTQMIGIFKALGANNMNIRKVFLYLSAFLISKGLFWGNVIGLVLCAFQYKTGLIKLNPTDYYIDKVPINFNILYIVLLNIGSLIAILLMIIIPSMIISRITPEKSIRFE